MRMEVSQPHSGLEFPMSTITISPLRQRMIEDMDARKLGAHSQRSHISSCKRFAAFLKRSPDMATAEDVRRFQLHLIETGSSGTVRNLVREAIVMERRESSYGYRERTSGPTSGGPGTE